MTLTFKDNRNNNLKTTPKYPHHFPTSKKLRSQQKKVFQRAEAARKDLEEIKYLEHEGDMLYFELVNRRVSNEETLRKAQEKLEKLNREIRYTDLVSKSAKREDVKRGQKRRDMAFRNSVHMY